MDRMHTLEFIQEQINNSTINLVLYTVLVMLFIHFLTHVRKYFAGSNAKIVHNAERFAIDVQDRQFEHLTQIIQWCSPS